MKKYILLLLVIGMMVSLQAQTQPPQFNASEFLDAPVPHKPKALKIEFCNNFLGATYQNYNVYGMLQMVLNNNIFNDSSLNASINYFLNVWPPASEMVALEQPTVYQQNVQQGGSYTVNENGRLISSTDVNNNAAYQYDLAAQSTATKKNKLHVYTLQSIVDDYVANPSNPNTTINQWKNQVGYNGVQTMAFPDRNSGCQIQSEWCTTHNVVTITTGAKKFVLEEAIIVSPIVLDMDGDGKLEASDGVSMPHPYRGGKVAEFDMDGDGLLDLVEWAGPNDGILMVVDGNEVSGRNLFGNTDGFYSGYEKLGTLDANNDKKLTGQELGTLSVWQDKNGNAKIDKGEVKSLAELGITSINLSYDKEFVSSFVQNGETKKMWDWYPCMFRLKRVK